MHLIMWHNIIPLECKDYFNFKTERGYIGGVLGKCSTKIGLSKVIPDEYEWCERYVSTEGKCFLLESFSLFLKETVCEIYL